MPPSKTILGRLFCRSRDAVPLPTPGTRNVLITSALPYVNNEPHLGNIIGCVLSADAFARFSRLRGDTTLFISGTDEYGTATETKALEEKTTCQALCDKYHAIHKRVYEDFGIDFDHFGRTTTKHQTAIAQDIFLKLHRNNCLVTDTVVQLYCESCSRFLADRYVEGTCPRCGFTDARGDQCDGCQQLLNAVDLISPRCKINGCTPVKRSSQHMFLDLGKFSGQLQGLVDCRAPDSKWSSNAVAVTRAWLKEGLRQRCITRDLKWGTPVPLDGEMGTKVFYVWFDAPIGYPSITASATPHWEKWWKKQQPPPPPPPPPSSSNATTKTQSPVPSTAVVDDDAVQLYQFMGKDNTPFHTVIFPASLLGTGEDWNLVRHISTTEYLNYEGTKFSKSRGTGVFGSHVAASGIPVSVWRYYLFANRPESADTDFNWTEFVMRNNNELLKNLGNYVNRLVKYTAANFDGIVPIVLSPSSRDASAVTCFGGQSASPSDAEFVSDVETLLAQYTDHMESLRLRAGLQCAMAVSARGNQYLQDNRLSSELLATSPDRAAAVVVHALSLAFVLSALVYPFMPAVSEGINRQLGLPDGAQPAHSVNFTLCLAAGHALGPQEYLFTRIDESVADNMRALYAGKPADLQGPRQPESSAATVQNGKSKRAAAAAEARQRTGSEASLGALDAALVPTALREKEAAVGSQAARVRELKSSGAEAHEVSEAVTTLLALKRDLANDTAALMAALKLRVIPT